jgi:predicted nucleic acid-binding protein
MRVVLDTNILVSAMISPTGHPASIYVSGSDFAALLG